MGVRAPLLFVERSNRIERLQSGLAARLMEPGRDPLAPATVVVQGPGMERWLAQSVATQYGICANTEFLFPRQFLDRLFAGDPASAPNESWDRQALTWAIARRLDAGRGEADFAPLARHLEAVDGDWRLVQLAEQIATLFDRYVSFRPEWIRDWIGASSLPLERDERWQARLVRELAADLGPGHFADRAVEFISAAQTGGTPAQLAALERTFPDRIEIFAVSTLPPLYLSVVDALASLRDVHLSVLSPSRSYWADLWQEVRDGDLSAAPAGEEPGLFDAAEATPATRLLAGLGRLGGDFQRCLEDLSAVHEGGTDQFESPLGRDGLLDSGASPNRGAQPSLLERLQADLLDLEGQVEPGEDDRIVLLSDESIQVHLCHGPRRELEVVEAALRNAFESDPTLTPEDVIVMAPRIDEIAPDIEAVFGVPYEEASRIPHRIADRGALRRSPVADAFAALLELLTGRMGRSELIDWLSRASSRERFGLDEEAVERLGEWAAGAGVRFGLDADHRAALDLASAEAHTWADGLARLALAHATGPSASVFAGSTPSPLDPFADPSVLGAMGDFDELLRDARAKIVQSKTVGAWCEWLDELLTQACAQSDATAHEHASVRGFLQQLSEQATAAKFDLKIPFEAIRERVVLALGSNPPPQAFLAGGVTFCELVPLRAIPFRVVVLLGMSDSAFPRGLPAPGFDLIARNPRAGDRDTRIDDRYLFLEALLSARDRLILTVPGRDVRDGSDLPPSIVVTELLDAICASFDSATETSLRKQLVVTHPLQSFSARYFEEGGDVRLRGRDAEAFAGAQARREAAEEGGGTPRQFLERLVVENHDSSSSTSSATPSSTPLPALSLNELIERVLRGTRYFSRDRLRIRLPREDDVIPDLDPFDLDPLEQFALGNALLEDLAGGTDEETALDTLMAQATIPQGLPGELAVRGLRAEVIEVARIGRARCVGEQAEDIEERLTLTVEGLGDCELSGRIDRLWTDARIAVGFARVGRRSELDVWIRHLFLCACVEAGHSAPNESVLIGRSEDKKKLERVVRFGPVANAREELARLFAWAWSAAGSPLPFFPKASRKFASKAATDRDQARRDAVAAYHGGDSTRFIMPESQEELAHERLWEGTDPLSDGDVDAPDLPFEHRFEDLAERVFAPLFAARETDVS